MGFWKMSQLGQFQTSVGISVAKKGPFWPLFGQKPRLTKVLGFLGFLASSAVVFYSKGGNPSLHPYFSPASQVKNDTFVFFLKKTECLWGFWGFYFL